MFLWPESKRLSAAARRRRQRRTAVRGLLVANAEGRQEDADYRTCRVTYFNGIKSHSDEHEEVNKNKRDFKNTNLSSTTAILPYPSSPRRCRPGECLFVSVPGKWGQTNPSTRLCQRGRLVRPNHSGRGRGSFRQLIKSKLGSAKQASQFLVRSAQCLPCLPKTWANHSVRQRPSRNRRGMMAAKPPRVFAHDVPDAEKMFAFLC